MTDITDVKFWLRTALIATIIYLVFGPVGVVIYGIIKALKMLKD